ncbi:hypothetical protein A3J19_02090 [Candidatus Daviesbacteria bacterium RIFCSPLOWO2_02_FULL_41_8]|uniref:Uncharacterized protein n=3 Tax=Candidatus Daviesiibacteriota TaxID=1752718 RepID=A0A1F5NLQ9_9BACT|nr:MAG: hypothetical protein A2871_02410 [Candidatus Daviesbacteria bacterium RIFCSPHIGHO2_01_FULL_41_23]OGE33768.1 MAG: hypothetical protein A3D83_04280 [Candidatus Daviesbacteria bacterium RIFCSPHIGHO2_02_FULL_41_10]OGE62035.1 MAG: hypothetical protein A2967_00025 [Candidatus Daviesbacteria bacterium RIFCSPLOWO2_01_FULL_41_32]OGE78464.1 MAG: hypothetical protein A3J19_02090 [Candidatus Daviesbacteria bacterium RIFCSPLOWO2_02_FULL_41_8]
MLIIKLRVKEAIHLPPWSDILVLTAQARLIVVRTVYTSGNFERKPSLLGGFLVQNLGIEICDCVVRRTRLSDPEQSEWASFA